MDILSKKKEKIKEYYNLALSYIQQDDLRSALYIIHNKMPVDLYDTSLNIMELSITNVVDEDKDLWELINKVDELLYKESYDEFDSDLLDSFKDSVF